jgi:hypothetical protein
VPIEKGGTGIHYLNPNQILIGNGINPIKSSTNLLWNDNTNTLNVSNLNITGDLHITGVNYSNVIPLSRGGLGISNINEGELLFGFDTNQIKTSSNIIWNNNNRLLDINGRLNVGNGLSGSGSNISNLQMSNLQSIGFNVRHLNSYELIFVNQNRLLSNASNIKWNENNKTLNINGDIFVNNITGNGLNITNLQTSNIQGFGFNINHLNPYDLIFINQNKQLSNASNIKWNDVNRLMDINGRLNVGRGISGSGSNISNIQLSNIEGFGFHINHLNPYELIFVNGDKQLSNASNIKWNDGEEWMDINGRLNVGQGISGSGSNISNIQLSNIEGFGFHINHLNPYELIFVNDNKQLSNASNIKWNHNTKVLEIDGKLTIGGGINVSGSNITNIQLSNIQGFGFNINHLNPYELIFVNDDKQLSNASNIKWNDGIGLMDMNGRLNVGRGISGSGSNISNIQLSNIQGFGFNINHLNPYELIFVNEDKQLSNASNIKWNDGTGVMDMNGRLNVARGISGSGSNISNIQLSNIQGFGFNINHLNPYELIFVNGEKQLSNASNIKWNDGTGVMDMNGRLNVGRGISGSGSNISNIQLSNIQGFGFNINHLNPYELIFVNGDNQLSNASNIKWNDGMGWMDINGRLNVGRGISGSGSNISNIQLSNIQGFGFNINHLNPYELIFVNGDKQLSNASNIKWNDGMGWMDINGRLNVGRGISGSGSNISNIQLSNIQGFGFNINHLNPYELIFVNGDKQLSNASNIKWNDGTGVMDMNGRLNVGRGISGSGSNISNIQLSNIQGFGFNINHLNPYELIFINGEKQLSNASNIKWNDGTRWMDINGGLNINSGLIYSNNQVLSNIYIWRGSIDNANTYYTNHNIYMGYDRYDPNYKLKVDGNIYISGNIVSLSDSRYKTNIKIIENAMDKINNLRGVYYDYKDITIGDNRRQIGMIAQEVEKIIPEAVYSTRDDIKSLSYDKIIGLLIEGMKEMSRHIYKLEEKINKLNI